MLKKYMIFGSVVLLLAALFTLTGCSQATDGDGGTTVVGLSENHLYGLVEANDVRRAVDSAKRTGRNVVLTDQLVIRGSGIGNPDVADFGDLPVRVEGHVTVTGNVIVNGSAANLSFVEDFGTVTVTSGGVFIYKGNGDKIYTADDNSGYKVKYVDNPLEAAQGTDARIAVPNYALGDGVAAHVTHLYVLDKVTVDSGSDVPDGSLGNPRIIVLREVDLTESNTDAFTDLIDGFIFAESAVLTSSSAVPVVIGLPPAVALPTIAANQAITVNFAGGMTGFRVERIEGPETVTISSSTTINGLSLGNVTASGKVVVNGTINSIEISQNDGDINIAGTTFSGLITIGDPVIPNMAYGVNAGTIAITAGTFNGVVAIHTNADKGTIALNNHNPIGSVAGPVSVISKNAGSISINASTITGGVTVASNSGEVILAPSALTANITGSPIVITRNESAGKVIFSKNIVLGGVPALIRVPNNYGSINFLGDITTVSSGTLGSATPGEKIAGSGKVVFGGDVIFADTTIIDCDVVFNGDVTRNAGALSFFGDVTLDYGRTITLGGTSLAFTLGKGKRILVGGGATPVLAAAGSDVGIANPNGLTLTAGLALTEDDEGSDALKDKTLFLGGTSISAFTGNLRVLGGGVLGIGGGNINITTTSSLTLENGATLALPATQSVVLGATIATIAGAGTVGDGDVSQLVASNGEVTFTAGAISGNGSTLASPADFGSPAITVATAANLTIEKVNIDVSANGSLVIDDGSTNTKITLVASLTNPGKITLSADSGSMDTITSSFDTSLGTNGTLKGAGALHTDGTTDEVDVGDLAAGQGSNLVIGIATAGNGDVTLSGEAGVTVNLTP
ncbi:MAG: hypothetical protein LBO65_02435 [Spirochaetaceae bacterium]|jgi:hypothetical protein|nr:hypothetical protein [Spirochaetaceae bacterium]